MGLESLNENLKEIKVDVVFSNRRLQYRPAIEDLRSVYFREMRKFISMPSQFGGLTGSKSFFGRMTATNSNSLLQVYTKAEVLFGRLGALIEDLRPHVRLGTVVDIDDLV